MSWKTKILGDPEKVAAHKDATEKLEGTEPETPEYYKANEAKGKTAADVPWYRC